MAKLSKSRKKELRLSVRSIVSVHVLEMDKEFSDLGDDEEEQLYVAQFHKELGKSINLTPAETGNAD
jgi:hypothetical protein